MPKLYLAQFLLHKCEYMRSRTTDEKSVLIWAENDIEAEKILMDEYENNNPYSYHHSVELYSLTEALTKKEKKNFSS